MDNTQLCERLIGELIGLARATDGSEHLISQSSTSLIQEALAAACRDSDADALEKLIGRVEEEKRKMVPDCFTCACPCGRTSAYDLARLDREDTDVRSLKMQLLQGIQGMASAAPECSSERLDRFFYTALIIIGMDDFRKDDLLPYVQEMEALKNA